MPPFTAGVSTLSGCPTPGAENGERGMARFSNPVNVAVGPEGDVYVADFDNHAIRVVTPAGTVRTLTRQSGFQRPFGLAFAPGGVLYVQTDRDPDGYTSDLSGSLWRVDLSTGVATVVAVDIGRPRGIAALADGRLVVTDFAHHDVRLFDPVGRSFTALAGARDQAGFVDETGAAARFQQPYGVVALDDGSIAVVDQLNHAVRRVTLAGVVTTIAGTGSPGAADGAAASATFREPQGIARDAAGTLYVTDRGNHVVRRIRSGVVDTVVGCGVAGWEDTDDVRAARLFGLEGLDVAPDGKLYIADGSGGEEMPYHRVRVALLPP